MKFIYKYVIRVFLKYFFQGLLYTVPLAVTIYVIYKLLNLIDKIIPFDTPGLGFLLLIGSITALGVLGSSIIAQPIIKYFQKLLARAPLIKTIYSAIKDLLSAFVGKKKRFDRPVLVKLNKDAEIEKLGFITSSDLSELGITGGKLAVYMPHSYAFSGNLFIVPKENVTPIDASSTDIMKFIVSGGVTEIEHEHE